MVSTVRAGNFSPRAISTSIFGIYAGMTGAVVLGTGSKFALSVGVLHPYQAPSLGFDRIIAVVAQDVYAADANGVAFAAGQLWVRSLTSDTLGDGYDNAPWVPVPSALPPGYTRNPRRNNRPAYHCRHYGASTTDNLSAYGAGPFLGAASFEPYYVTEASGLKPIRSPLGGQYDILANFTGYLGATYGWGPYATDDAVRNSSDSTLSTTPKSRYTALHPGWRHATLIARWSAVFYGFATAATTTEMVIDGTTYSVPKASMVYNASSGLYEYTVEHGPTTQAAHGQLTQVEWRAYLAGVAPAAHSGTSVLLRLSPRVDIPLPYSASWRGLVAPGGILTGGNIPGY